MVRISELFPLLSRALTRVRCPICDDSIEVPVCLTCRDRLPWITLAPPSAPAAVFAAWRYAEPAAAAVRRLKYEDRPDLAHPLVALAAPTVGPLIGECPDLIVPVPLHPHRLAERGFNQATLLARAFRRELRSRLAGSVVAPRVLRRHADTAKLARKGRMGRQREVTGAFSIRDPRRVCGRRVLLVDDVVTTGATVEACAEVLRQAGARVTGVAALCRTVNDR